MKYIKRFDEISEGIELHTTKDDKKIKLSDKEKVKLELKFYKKNKPHTPSQITSFNKTIRKAKKLGLL